MITINDIMVGNRFNEGTVLEVRTEGVVTNFHFISKTIGNTSNSEAVKKETIVSYDKLTPIPLQFDMLGDFDFEKYLNNNGIRLILFEGYVSLRLMFNRFPIVLEIDNSRMPLHNIKHVHELQNFINNFKTK